MSSGKAVLLQSSLLDELRRILQKDTPKSLHILALVHNIISGKLKGADVYTNGWPDFSAVVCRYEDVLFHQHLCCYTSKAEDLISLLNEAGLILPEEKWIMLVEDYIAEMLLGSIRYGEDIAVSEDVHTYYLPQSANLNESQTYPDGFVLKSLKEHHSDIVAPLWPHSDNLPVKQLFFKLMIKTYHSVGLFSQDEPDKPIAWCMQYPYGQPSNLYITEEYRRRGFASLLLEHMCKRIRADGLIPQAGVDDYNDGSKKLMQKFGFVEHAKFRYVRHLV